MTTLKNLVDETTNIKNELVECHSNLKKNLADIGVECLPADKMRNLIDKVSYLKNIRLPKWFEYNDFYINIKNNPSPLRAPSTCAVGEKIYMIGGFLYDGTNRQQNLCYDTITNEYTYKVPLSDGRSAAKATASSVEEKIYYFGGTANGTNDYTCRSGVLCYDTNANTWTTLISNSFGVLNASSCVVDGMIYIVGGDVNSNSFTNEVSMYNPITNTITSKTRMSERTSKHCIVSLGRNIYRIGGQYNNTPNTVEKYNVDTDEWCNVSNLCSPKRYPQACVVDDYIYVFGGSNTIETTVIVEKYDAKTNIWSTKRNLPKSMVDHRVVSCDNFPYIFGGFISGTTNLNSEAYCYLI